MRMADTHEYNILKDKNLFDKKFLKFPQKFALFKSIIHILLII